MSAYLNGELANELRQRSMSSTMGMTTKMSRELVMQEIDKMRRQKHYPHDPSHCTAECKKKGMYAIGIPVVILFLVLGKKISGEVKRTEVNNFCLMKDAIC